MPETTREKKIRAFVALKTPDAWDAHLAALQAELKAELRSKAIGWVKPEQLHITVRFLGYVPSGEIEAIVAAMAQACAGVKRFTLQCEGMGCFPHARAPRVLWAGLSGDTAAAGELQAGVNAATAAFGEPPEERPFKPHLTLARIERLDRPTLEQLRQVLERGFQLADTWEVSEVRLMQSHLTPQGAQYEEIARMPLI